MVVLALAAAPAALAHAKLIAVEPANGATLATAPASVRLYFDDPVAVGPGNAVVSADHRSVLAGPPRLERKDHLLVLPLQPHLPNGDYSVSWRVFSDDGHLESGVLAFRVGAAAAGAGAPRPVLAAASTGPGFMDVLARWLLLGGILIAGGTALFFLLVSRAAVRRTATTIAFALLAVALGGAWLVHAADGAATRFERVTKVTVIVALVGVLLAALARARPRLVAPALVLPLALLARPDPRRPRLPGLGRPADLDRGGPRPRRRRRLLDRRHPPARAAAARRAGRAGGQAVLPLRPARRGADRRLGPRPRARRADRCLAALVDRLRAGDLRQDGALPRAHRAGLDEPPGARRSRAACAAASGSSSCCSCSSLVAVAVLTSLRPGRDVELRPGVDRPRGRAGPAPAARDGRLRRAGAGARRRAVGASRHPARADRHGDRPDGLRRRRPRRAALGPLGCRRPVGRRPPVRARVLRGVDRVGPPEPLRRRRSVASGLPRSLDVPRAAMASPRSAPPS